MPTFDNDDLSKGLEGFLGRAAEVISRGRDEILRASRIGKARLVDLTQLRRERARLVLRLGEEAYREMQAGALHRDELEKTYARIVEIDERIAAKEAEIEKIRRDAAGAPASEAPRASRPKRRRNARKNADEDADL